MYCNRKDPLWLYNQYLLTHYFFLGGVLKNKCFLCAKYLIEHKEI